MLTVHHDGGGPVKGRQDNSHVHSTVFSPDGRYLFAQDLGADKLMRIATHPTAAVACSARPRSATRSSNAGSGPRHLIFDASGKHAYLTTEMKRRSSSSITRRQAHAQADPADDRARLQGQDGGGAIHLSPDGRFLYATNRGDANEIVIYAVDPSNGQ